MRYVATLLHRRSPSPAFVFSGCLLVAWSSAALVPLHWLELTHAWIWLALLAVAVAGHADRSLILACLLALWVDERFVIGLPLALLVRRADQPGTGLLSAVGIRAATLAPYMGLRLILRVPHSAAATEFFVNYIKGGFLPTFPWARLGWLMAYRLGWVSIAFALHRHRFPLGLVTAATWVTMLLLAADISRAAAIVCPALLLGLFIWARERPTTAARDLLILGVFNLLVPAMHVVYNKTDLISPLPIELYRLLRGG